MKSGECHHDRLHHSIKFGLPHRDKESLPTFRIMISRQQRGPRHLAKGRCWVNSKLEYLASHGYPSSFPQGSVVLSVCCRLGCRVVACTLALLCNRKTLWDLHDALVERTRGVHTAKCAGRGNAPLPPPAGTCMMTDCEA